MDSREVVRVVKDIRQRFGKEILSDKIKFLSAFDDFAPKLRKEKKILSVALDEQINYIFLDADSREAEKKAVAIKNATARLTEEAWFSERAVQMIMECFAGALDWNISSFGLSENHSDLSRRKSLEIRTAAIQSRGVSGELLYAKGRQLYIEKDYREAAIYFIMAAVKGTAEAQNDLAMCYEHGCGVPEDKAKAFEWYLKAANHRCVRAQYNVGRCYSGGVGTAEDKLRAFAWYLKAAIQGHAEAQIYVAYDYFYGENIGKNRRKAFEWYRRAAEQGNAYAQNETGYCCYNGYGTDEDKQQAAEWYKKAAEQGNAAAQFNFGWCCYHGIGIDKNRKQAKYWYKKAADGGNAEAKEILRKL